MKHEYELLTTLIHAAISSKGMKAKAQAKIIVNEIFKTTTDKMLKKINKQGCHESNYTESQFDILAALIETIIKTERDYFNDRKKAEIIVSGLIMPHLEYLKKIDKLTTGIIFKKEQK